MGGMTLINMPVIIYLGKYAIRALKDYERQLKTGKEITSHLLETARNRNNITLI